MCQKKRLQEWLKKIQKEVAPKMPILVSSDIIESLFGQFKYIMARSPQAEPDEGWVSISVTQQNHAIEVVPQCNFIDG